MIKKIVSIWLSILLCFSGLAVLFVVDTPVVLVEMVSASTLYVNTSGSGGAYTSIQDAINDSQNGDTVYVYAGTYYENVIVNRSITLEGESRDTTFINGTDDGHGIYVTEDYVNVSGFNITTNDLEVNYALYIHSRQYVNISNCVMYKSWYGIRVAYSHNINISKSKIIGNKNGIYFPFSSNVYINESEFTSNWGEAIYTNGARNIFVRNSNITGTGGHFELHTNSSITVFNISFSESQVYFDDVGSSLRVGWHLDVYVNDSMEAPVENAEVYVYNITGDLDSKGMTDSAGFSYNLECIEKVLSNGPTVYFTPHTVVSYKIGVGGNNSQLSITNNSRLDQTLYPGNNTKISQMHFSHSPVMDDTDFYINATIHNTGEYTQNIDIYFYDNGVHVGIDALNLASGETQTASLLYSTYFGFHEINISLDPLDSILEYNEFDNEMKQELAVDWFVTTSESVQNQDLVIANLTIAAGGSLTLTNVSIQMRCKFHGQYNIEVQDGGALTMIISDISGYYASYNYMFWARSGASLQINGGKIRDCGYVSNPNGLTVETDNAEFYGVEFRDNFYGITITNASDTIIENCLFENNYRDGIIGKYSSNLTISDSTFLNMSSGIRFFSTTNSTIENCLFSDGEYYAVNLIDNSNNNTVIDSEMQSNTFGGVTIYYSFYNRLINLTINDSLSNGIEFSSSASNTEIINSTISNCYQGIDIYRSDSVTITNVHIINSSWGIKVTDSTLPVFNSTITNATVDDVFLNGWAHLSLINTSFNRNNVDVTQVSDLQVGWFLTVNIEDSGGQPIPYAFVEVYDNDENLDSNQTADSEGYARYITVMEYTQDVTTTIIHTPHTITALNPWYHKDSQVHTIDNNKEITITLADNSQPVADFSVETQGDLYLPFIFNASNSTDSEDPLSELQVRWDFENDGVWDTGWSTSKTAAHQYLLSGNHTVLLEVRDNDLLTHNKTLKIEIANIPPTAVFEVSPQSGNISQTFNFDASGSSDTEDEIESLLVRWDFDNDGVWETAWNSTKTASYQYDSLGTYTVKMEVMDTKGLTTSATTTVNVIIFEDTDGDEILDHEDEDDDNDGYLDEWENFLGSDPKDPADTPLDTDGDGLPDGDENNSQPWMDTDDDGDGIHDIRDPRPKDPGADEEMELMDYWWILLIVAAIIIVVVLAILMKRKPKEPVQETQIESTQEITQPMDQEIPPPPAEPSYEPPMQLPPPPPPPPPTS